MGYTGIAHIIHGAFFDEKTAEEVFKILNIDTNDEKLEFPYIYMKIEGTDYEISDYSDCGCDPITYSIILRSQSFEVTGKRNGRQVPAVIEPASCEEIKKFKKWLKETFGNLLTYSHHIQWTCG